MTAQSVAVVCIFFGFLPGLSADEPQQPTPAHADVSYGPDVRNVIDFWKADAAGARPVIVYIHGGGMVDRRQEQKGAGDSAVSGARNFLCCDQLSSHSGASPASTSS